ncbi:regulatory protein RecX [Microlunatus speluncae]|uniref:regulatory protein RecX n=1 Tax=Microlunatus speluncae TaxID=2594267 RepID=UPI001375A988|nr:regulatory protein RecX [Microlunatus speluncae]
MEQPPRSLPEPVEGQAGVPAEPSDQAAPGRPRTGSGRSAKGRSGRRRRTDEPDDRHDGPEADPEGLARTIVLRKLTGQARTRQELAKALADRDVPVEAADAVLDRMEEVGLVDDRSFAQDWVESRQSRRQLSRSAIKRELITKGVDRDDIDDALAGVDDEDELNAARALAEKKVRSMSRLEPQVRYRRLAGALARRGFPSHVTSQVLGEVLSD